MSDISWHTPSFVESVGTGSSFRVVAYQHVVDDPDDIGYIGGSRLITDGLPDTSSVISHPYGNAHIQPIFLRWSHHFQLLRRWRGNFTHGAGEPWVTCALSHKHDSKLLIVTHAHLSTSDAPHAGSIRSCQVMELMNHLCIARNAISMECNVAVHNVSCIILIDYNETYDAVGAMSSTLVSHHKTIPMKFTYSYTTRMTDNVMYTDDGIVQLARRADRQHGSAHTTMGAEFVFC